MLVITGPGRSGTSVLALFCQKLGCDPGGAWYDSVDAGLENPRVVKINDALLREIRQKGTTEETLRIYGEEMRQIRAAVIKDPRFTIHPAVLSAWCSVRNDLAVLVTYRNPEHCVASRLRQARFLTDRRNKNTPDAIRRQIADSMETLLELEIPFQLLLFPKFLGQFDRVYKGLQELGMDIERRQAESVWMEIVDRNKVHIGGPVTLDPRITQHRVSVHERMIDAQRLWKRVFHLQDYFEDAPRDESFTSSPSVDEVAVTLSHRH